MEMLVSFMKFSLMAFAVLGLQLPANAQSLPGALIATVLSSLSQAVCAQTADAVDRLKARSQFEAIERSKCVDRLFQGMAETPDPAQPQGPNWIISGTTSPVVGRRSLR